MFGCLRVDPFSVRPRVSVLSTLRNLLGIRKLRSIVYSRNTTPLFVSGKTCTRVLRQWLRSQYIDVLRGTRIVSWTSLLREAPPPSGLLGVKSLVFRLLSLLPDGFQSRVPVTVPSPTSPGCGTGTRESGGGARSGGGP